MTFHVTFDDLHHKHFTILLHWETIIGIFNHPGTLFRTHNRLLLYPSFLHVDDNEGGLLKLHYIDEGPRDASIVLMLHGEPSWAYLYRKMVEPVVAAGYRVIAPDLVGFGKSDKPTKPGDYTYQRHLDWVRQVVIQLNLKNITLVCQDWGGY